MKFSLVFDIVIYGKDLYKKFLFYYYDLFKFEDEWGYWYIGRFEESMFMDMLIEGDIYYVGVEMLCSCEVDGL